MTLANSFWLGSLRCLKKKSYIGIVILKLYSQVKTKVINDIFVPNTGYNYVNYDNNATFISKNLCSSREFNF
jgi:hypothetical protein